MGEKEVRVWKLVTYVLIGFELFFFIKDIFEGNMKFALVDGLIILNACVLLMNFDRCIALIKHEELLEKLEKDMIDPLLKEIVKNPEMWKGDKEITISVKREDE